MVILHLNKNSEEKMSKENDKKTKAEQAGTEVASVFGVDIDTSRVGIRKKGKSIHGHANDILEKNGKMTYFGAIRLGYSF